MKYKVGGRPVKVGDEIVLGRETDHHPEVPWESARDKYVGRTTKIRELDIGNATAKPVATVDIDDGRDWWRLEDMTWPDADEDEDEDEEDEEEEEAVSTKAKRTLRKYVKDGKTGLSIGASRRAARILVEKTKSVAGERWPEFFSTPIGKELEEPVVVMALGLLASISEDTVPYASEVEAAVHLTLQGIIAEKSDLYLACASEILPIVGSAVGKALPEKK